ncbi:hypothetical protein PYCC9005_000878 [Savitreella phatthalungensis]
MHARKNETSSDTETATSKHKRDPLSADVKRVSMDSPGPRPQERPIDRRSLAAHANLPTARDTFVHSQSSLAESTQKLASHAESPSYNDHSSAVAANEASGASDHLTYDSFSSGNGIRKGQFSAWTTPPPLPLSETRGTGHSSAHLVDHRNVSLHLPLPGEQFTPTHHQAGQHHQTSGSHVLSSASALAGRARTEDLKSWLHIAQQTNPISSILQLEGEIDPFRSFSADPRRAFPRLTSPSTGFGQFSRVEQTWFNRLTNQAAGGPVTEKRWYDIVRGMQGDLFNMAPPLCEISIAGQRARVSEACRLRMVRAVYPQIENPFDPATYVDSEALNQVALRFPTCQAFDCALDRYFDSWDREAPFLHRPVFSISTCPPIMLFCMSCIGFVLSGLEDDMYFVRSNFNAIRQCIVAELDKKLTSTTKESLPTCAAAFLFLKLAALISDRDHLSPCQLLYNSLLHLAQLHGIFSVYARQSTSEMYENFGDLKERWHAWGRVESFKRVVISLMRLDSAYCSFLRAPPAIRVAKIEVPLPCDDLLFAAPSAEQWWQLQQEQRLLIILPTIGSASGLEKLMDAGVQSYYSLHSVLNYLQLRTADAYQRLLDVQAGRDRAQFILVPVEYYSQEPMLCDIVRQVVAFKRAFPHVAPKQLAAWQQINCDVFWHYLCLTLTVNQDLIEIAASRDGIRSASEAIDSIASWARTQAARRALLHAAHVFKVLREHQQPELSSIYASFAVFTSALVITLYVFACPSDADELETASYELTSPIDWSQLGFVGIGEEASDAPGIAAERFIRFGGNWSFDEVYLHGFVGARHVLSLFADLLRTCGRYNFRQMSQILLMMKDLLHQTT